MNLFLHRLAGVVLGSMALFGSPALGSEPVKSERRVDVLIVLSAPLAEKCGCDVSDAPDSNHPDKLTEFCSIAQACLELDDIQTTLEKGRCASVSGVVCEAVSSPCKATIKVRVTVHSVCCCAEHANGVNVFAVGHGCEFVPLGVSFREVVTITRQLPCESENDETIFLQASCEHECADIDDLAESNNAQVGYYREFTCGDCKKP